MLQDISPSLQAHRSVKLIRDLGQLPEQLRHGAVSIGNFDGVHQGHAKILRRLVAEARRLGRSAVVFTFEPSPAQVLRPDRAPPPLSWLDRKVQLITALGVDAVIAYSTTESFLRLEPRQFFEQVVRGTLAARALVEGPNFFFGHNRHGDVESLGEFCREVGVFMEVVPPVVLDGQMVSSSRVRTLVRQGQMDVVRRMLTAPYRIHGRVMHGAGRGRQLGFPTANLGAVDTLLPAEGIYAGRAYVDGQSWPAAISLGPNPTFDEGSLKVEIHLLGFSGNLYERELEVDFLSRLRDIKRFQSVGELLAQMDQDMKATRNIAVATDVQGA
jgi:riboflavin kinase/FMN adenylyltransferase